ncbi:hypothetical protein [Halomonas sp. YLGW01]|uniref:hypothetical protein n=1 Tax=Halomonas sp. YLGW01 TaxID=2773308 RepID=UPI001781DDAA|nr:hypothetical protein [Halomonas sp. YLGW01]
MSPRKHRHKPRHGATRRVPRTAAPRRWLSRLDAWLTEPRLNALVDIAVLTALITAGLSLAVTLWLAP